MILRKDVHKEGMLGEGAFGEVFAGTLKIKKRNKCKWP